MEETAQRFYLERFEDYLRFERGLSSKTAEAYAADLVQFVSFAEGRGMRLRRASTPELREFVYRLKAAGSPPARSAARYLRCGLLRVPAGRRLIESTPANCWRVP